MAIDTTSRNLATAALKKGGGGSGVTNHSALSGRNAANQHPISAITDLEETLNKKIEDASKDDKQYVRKNGAWEEITTSRSINWRGAFQLGNMYYINDVVKAEDGNEYIAIVDGVVLPPPSAGWDLFLEGGGIAEAPTDEKYYSRKDGEWTDLFDKQEEPSFETIVARPEEGNIYNGTSTNTHYYFKNGQEKFEDSYLKSFYHKAVTIGVAHHIYYTINSSPLVAGATTYHTPTNWLCKVIPTDTELHKYDVTEDSDPRVTWNPDCIVNGRLYIPKDAKLSVGSSTLTGILTGTFSYGSGADKINTIHPENNTFFSAANPLGNNSTNNICHGIEVDKLVTEEGYSQPDLKEFDNRIKMLETKPTPSPSPTNNPYKGKYISWLGDSITTFSGWMPSGNASHYPTGSVQNVDQTYWKKVMDRLEMNLCLNNSWSGSRMSGTGTSSGVYRADNMHNGAQDPDVIVINLGTNDFNGGVAMGSYNGVGNVPTDASTFGEAYAICLDKMLKRYPRAQVWCCTFPGGERHGTTQSFPERHSNGTELTQYNDVIRNIATAFGCRVIELARCGLNTVNVQVYMNDYSSGTGQALHPNEAGMELMANQVIGQLLSYSPGGDGARINGITPVPTDVYTKVETNEKIRTDVDKEFSWSTVRPENEITKPYIYDAKEYIEVGTLAASAGTYRLSHELYQGLRGAYLNEIQAKASVAGNILTLTMVKAPQGMVPGNPTEGMATAITIATINMTDTNTNWYKLDGTDSRVAIHDTKFIRNGRVFLPADEWFLCFGSPTANGWRYQLGTVTPLSPLTFSSIPAAPGNIAVNTSSRLTFGWKTDVIVGLTTEILDTKTPEFYNISTDTPGDLDQAGTYFPSDQPDISEHYLEEISFVSSTVGDVCYVNLIEMVDGIVTGKPCNTSMLKKLFTITATKAGEREVFKLDGTDPRVQIHTLAMPYIKNGRFFMPKNHYFAYGGANGTTRGWYYNGVQTKPNNPGNRNQVYFTMSSTSTIPALPVSPSPTANTLSFGWVVSKINEDTGEKTYYNEELQELNSRIKYLEDFIKEHLENE